MIRQFVCYSWFHTSRALRNAAHTLQHWKSSESPLMPFLRCWSFYIHLSNQIQRQTRREKNSRDNGASQGALGRIVLSAEDHLHWTCVHTSQNHPLPHLGQSWAGIQLTTILSACILSSRPENLGSSTSSRPYHTIQNNWVSLLTPHVDLASKDQSFLSISETSRGIVGIDQSPVLDR